MDIPVRVCETELIAPDTHVIRQLAGEGTGPVAIYVNSMVITGAEPVIVDCGPAVTREAWLDTVFGIVDPTDVRWIYLSHDDADHTGNLPQVLEACPNATLVTNWFTRGAHGRRLPAAARPDALGERRRVVPRRRPRPRGAVGRRPSTARPREGCSTRSRASTGPPTASGRR